MNLGKTRSKYDLSLVVHHVHLQPLGINGTLSGQTENESIPFRSIFKNHIMSEGWIFPIAGKKSELDLVGKIL